MTKQNQNKLKFLGTIEQGAPVAIGTFDQPAEEGILGKKTF